MDEYIDWLGDASVFSTPDANIGYRQIEREDGDKNKATFTTHCGIFRFLGMPSGLTNAPATFQWAFGIILSKVKWQYALAFIDDLNIYSCAVEGPLTNVKHVLQLLKDAGEP